MAFINLEEVEQFATIEPRPAQADLFFGSSTARQNRPSRESTHVATIVFHRVSSDLEVFRVR
jgi:hypothetical protein